MITYFEIHNKQVQVRLNGQVVGNIKMVVGGWQYVPKDSKQGGEIFKTIEEVKRSLEAE